MTRHEILMDDVAARAQAAVRILLLAFLLLATVVVVVVVVAATGGGRAQAAVVLLGGEHAVLRAHAAVLVSIVARVRVAIATATKRVTQTHVVQLAGGVVEVFAAAGVDGGVVVLVRG